MPDPSVSERAKKNDQSCVRTGKSLVRRARQDRSSARETHERFPMFLDDVVRCQEERLHFRELVSAKTRRSSLWLADVSATLPWRGCE